ncbi:hypothetical protein ACPV3P_05995 [Photobacterium damselae]|uniref:hypothetical protein n=1 Tax=Photobacterium damselae TaxID=38293 RepID=UPI00254329B2
MLKSTILCVFEGEKREHDYFDSLKQQLLNNQNEDIIMCSYGNDIFELFKDLDEDDDFDIFELIKESKDAPKNKILLADYTNDDINQIYLFFDMEVQDDKYDADTLRKMLSIFDMEDNHGKLFISYPMVEALRDIPSFGEYIEHCIDKDKCKGKIYKQLSSKRCMPYLNQIKKLNRDNWLDIIKINIDKANYIVSSSIHHECCPEQIDILEKQLIKLEEDDKLHILSAYPLFAYYHIPKEQLILD